MAKTLTTGEFLEKMLKVEPAIISDFFVKQGIAFPKKIKIDIMRNALRDYVVKTRKECLTLDSRKNYRLLWFNTFTEFQLEDLFDEVAENQAIQNDYVKKLYLKVLIELKTLSMDSLKLFVSYLDSQPANQVFETTLANEVNVAFRPMFVESEGEFEGVPYEQFRAIVHNSTTQNDLDKLGAKYGITIPKKFSGEYVRDYVMQKMKNKGLLTDDMKAQLETAKATEVRKIAVANGIKNVITLNKKETIEYILERVIPNYQEPESEMVYEMTIPINPDEEKYSTLLLQYEQMGGEIQNLKDSVQDMSEAGKAEAEAKLKEKEAELADTRAKLDEITKKFSVLEIRSGKELENNIFKAYDQKAATAGYDLTAQSVPQVQPQMATQMPSQNQLILADDATAFQPSTLPAFYDPDAIYDDDEAFMDKLRAMASVSGYSILIVVLHILVMLGIGAAVFCILFAAI